MRIDKENIVVLLTEYAEKHPLAVKSGSEYIYQDDKAQVDAIDLVASIFDNIEP